MNGPGDREGPASKTGEALRIALQDRLEGACKAGPKQGTPAVPDHTLIRCIGAGAYGEVFLARNALGTPRAVKVVYRARFEEDRPYQREFNGILKYEPISRTHEGLMAVLHVGCNDDDGYFYYVMELADDSSAQCGVRSVELPSAEWGVRSVEFNSGTGPSPTPHSALRTPHSYAPHTLREEVRRRGRLPAVEAAQVGLRVASALAHLHAHGLVHRDIKPSNVIFIGGQPKLADIGLVTGAYDSRSFVGTEGFIPPEGPGAPQADLYGLGKLLYELVTGRDRLEFPQLPPGVRDAAESEAILELNEVITRACAPYSRDRYTATSEIVADLNLFLSGRSLRGARKLERHLTLLKRFCIASCVVLAFAAGALWLAHEAALRAHQREQQSQQQALLESTLRRRAEAAEHTSQNQLFFALLEQARGLVRGRELGQRVRALEAIRQAGAISNAAPLRAVAFSALALPDLRFTRELPAGPDTSSWGMDPSFRRLAICRGTAAVEIDSVLDGRRLATLPPSASLSASWARWSPDGHFLAVRRDRSSESAVLELWDVARRRLVQLFATVPSSTAPFHPLLPQIFVASNDAIDCWDLETQKEIRRFEVEGKPISIALAPDGARLAVASYARSRSILTVVRVADGVRLTGLAIKDSVACLDWHPDARWLGVVDHGGSVHLVDSFNAESTVLGRHKAQAIHAVFSPDGGYLISGGWERELICWDLRTLERAFTIDLDSFEASFSADGRQCAIANGSGIQIHSFESPANLQFPEELGGRIRRAAFSPDGRWLAAIGKERLGLWDLANRSPGAVVVQGADAASILFSPDSSQLYTSRADDWFRWQVLPSTNPLTPPALTPATMQPPEGFCSICAASNAIVFTGARGSKLASFNSLPREAGDWSNTVDGVTGSSPDGRWLAIFQPYSPWLHVYELPDFKTVATLTNRDNIYSFEFSPSGDQLAVSSPRRVELWDTRTWQKARELTNFMSFMFSTDSRCWWLTRDYQHGGLYDSRTLEPLLPLPNGTLPLALTRDGRYLAVSVDARRVQVWDLMSVRQEFRKLGVDWRLDN